MIVKNNKIFISQRNMNRLFHGSKKVWEVLRSEGAEILTMGSIGDPNGKGVVVRVPQGQHPRSEVVGIDLPDEKLRLLTDWRHKFITSNIAAREEFHVKELRVQGLPPIVVETPEMKELRCGHGR